MSYCFYAKEKGEHTELNQGFINKTGILLFKVSYHIILRIVINFWVMFVITICLFEVQPTLAMKLPKKLNFETFCQCLKNTQN